METEQGIKKNATLQIVTSRESMNTKITALVFLCICSLSFSCARHKDSDLMDESKLAYKAPMNEVEVVTLRRQAFPMQLVSNGKLSAASRSSLSFDGTGVISKVNFSNGSHVNAGDVIAELENIAQRLAMESAEISLDKAQLDYLDVLVGLGYSGDDNVPEDLKKVAEIRSGIRSARNEYEKSRRALESTALKAPFSGKVADIHLGAWDMTDGKPFCTIVNDDYFDVKFTILESELPIISIGQNVKVRLFAGDVSKNHTGTILTVNPVVDEKGQIEVCARIKGGQGMLDGMNVRVTVEKMMPQMLVVPKSAVVIRDNLEVLFRYNNGKSDWVYVLTVSANSESYAVVANEDRGASLNEGDQIICSGNLNLADGSQVKIKE